MAKIEALRRILTAETIKRLLRNGQGDQVTEQMFEEASPVHLRDGYDLPLDDASRARRAVQIGAGVDPNLTNTMSEAREIYGINQPITMLDNGVTPREIEAADREAYAELQQLYGDRLEDLYDDELYMVTEKVAAAMSEPENVTRYDNLAAMEEAYAPYMLNSLNRAVDAPYRAGPVEAWHGYLEAPRGPTGTVEGMDAATLRAATAPPPVRAVRRLPGALMDPRLTHLRHPMAAVGGLGVYGILPTEEEMQPLRDYLGEQ